MLKHLPTMLETQVQSLGREDLLEKEMATHSSILAWRIPWMEVPGRLQSMGLQRIGHNLVTKQQQQKQPFTYTQTHTQSHLAVRALLSDFFIFPWYHKMLLGNIIKEALSGNLQA